MSKDFHHGVIYWSENLKASHLSGQIGWLVHPWIECSCFTGWAATKRCLGKAHNMETCPCAVKRWDTKIYIQYYSVVENKYGVKSVSRGNLKRKSISNILKCLSLGVLCSFHLSCFLKKFLWCIWHYFNGGHSSIIIFSVFKIYSGKNFKILIL